jgi:hypothetical protein
MLWLPCSATGDKSRERVIFIDIKIIKSAFRKRDPLPRSRLALVTFRKGHLVGPPKG